MANEIKCPKCGTEISVDDIYVQKIINLKVQKSLDDQKAQLSIDLKNDLEKEQSVKTKELENKLLIEKNKREEAEKNELKLRQEKEKIDEEKKNWDLEKARQLENEKELITKKVDEENRFKLLEKDKKIEDMQKSLEEARRKGSQGSMQTQGEVLELSIEEMLKSNFPLDKIEPVPKGINGADIIQIVYGPTGQPAGKIAWETKRTKNWTEEWVQKLKDDSRTIHADIAILISETLPKEIENFGLYKGVWVCNYSIIPGVAAAMRSQLINVSSAITAETGKDEKMEAIYSYLTSNAFSQKIQALVETFEMMKQDLDKEKRGIQKLWATREAQITRLATNTIDMYGGIKGRAGAALPTIEILELENPE